MNRNTKSSILKFILIIIISVFQDNAHTASLDKALPIERKPNTSLIQNLMSDVFSFECNFFLGCQNPIFFQNGVLKESPIIDLLLVMGQSNAVGSGSNGALMGYDPVDATIYLSYVEGVPGTAKCTAHSKGILTMVAQKQPALCLDSKGNVGYIFASGTGFGPEIGLARKLKKGKMNNFGVFKFAWGSTSLAEDWKPFSSNGYQLFNKFLYHLREIAKGYNQKNYRVRVAALFWMQGESDALELDASNAYHQNFKGFIDIIKMFVGNPKLPVIVGLIAPYRPPTNSWVYAEKVRQAQMKIASKWIETADLPLDTDGVHYNSNGLLFLGGRFADAYLSINR